MKNIILILSILTIACTPDEFGPIGERPDRVAQLSGTWSIAEVVQIDNDAVRKGFPDFAQKQDVTSTFNYQAYELTLNADGSFTVNTGTSPNIIGNLSEGSWEVDNADYPGQILFSNNTGSSTITIGSFAAIASNELQLKKIRYQEKSGKLQPVITYNYKMIKNN